MDAEGNRGAHRSRSTCLDDAGDSSFEAYVRVERAHADDLGRSLGALAQPRTYHVALAGAGNRVSILSLELSPIYPFENDFNTPHPPETDASSVFLDKRGG